MKLIWESIWQNFANLITTIGIILATYLHFLLWNRHSLTDPIIFYLILLILASDLFDGQLARWLKIITPVGEFLDKARDKYFSCPVFAFFLKTLWTDGVNGVWHSVAKILVLFVLAGELFLILIWIVGYLKKISTRIERAGKIKTGFYFISIALWFFLKMKQWPSPYFSIILVIGLLAGAFFSFDSIRFYIHRYRQIK